MMATTDQKIDESLSALSKAVATLETTVAGMEKRLHMVYTVVVLVIGAVGGPNAIQAIVGSK